MCYTVESWYNINIPHISESSKTKNQVEQLQLNKFQFTA